MIPAAPPNAPDWFKQWVDDLDATASRWGIPDGKRPVLLPTFAVANLPSASKYVRCAIYVQDGTGNKRIAISDGAAWRFPDGNVVS
ncbi:hypothetical protein [Telmatospirillum sp.]|uniref:hypothetical protein n=1 Tax=Telmatospirillum sp. TaxID=2079197 RepID=UPI00284510D3|nr:hypothetical protein [Telmatospirillum sp.]MDR3439878.1 hypothetical protein [Telmatospirillum sp.]